jgi:hypothetical protein
MREYGPVLYPAYADAAILGTRAQSFIDELRKLDPEDVDRLRQMLGVATPLGAGDAVATATRSRRTRQHRPGRSQSPRLSMSKRTREILAALHPGEAK